MLFDPMPYKGGNVFAESRVINVAAFPCFTPSIYKNEHAIKRRGRAPVKVNKYNLHQLLKR